MENLDEIREKKIFRNKVLIIGGIAVLVIVAVVVFLIVRKGSKETFDSSAVNLNTPLQETSSGKAEPLFSQDIPSWVNYHWSGKLNTHYPSNWKFEEEIAESGLVTGLKLTPPTGNIEDVIFIGGASVKCSSVLKYSKNECLKNKIQVPFYTNSKNQEVLSAFDLIFQNTILTEEEK